MSGDPSATGSAVSAPLSEWRADLRRATWASASVLRLHGWAFDRYAPEAEGDWEVWLEGALPGGEPTQFPGSVMGATSDEVNAVARDGNHDRRTSAFVADIDLRAIVTTATASEFASSWKVTVARTIDGHQSSGGFTGRDRTGSADTIPTRCIEGCFVRSDWTAEGLVLTVARRAATVIDACVTDRTVHATVRVVGATPTGVIFTRGSDEVVEGTLSATGTAAAGLVEISVPVGDGGIDPASQAKWYGHLTLPAGKRRFLHWGLDADRVGDWAQPTGSVLLVRGARGAFRIDGVEPGVLIESVAVLAEGDFADIPVIRLGGSVRGMRAAELRFEGERQQLGPARVEAVGGGFTVDIPFAVPAPVWSSRLELAGVGQFLLRARDGESATAVELDPHLAATLYEQHFGAAITVRIERTPENGLRLNVTAPRAADELGPYAQRRLAESVADLPVVPGTVYAESFLGLDVACNPLALQLALQQRDPNSTFTWGVQHRAITSPRGTTAVIRRSAAWWRARATAEIVLVNDWLNPGFVRKPGQTVLQTWHGTPYKKLSLDRPGQEAPKYQRKVADETAAWQYVLAESDYMAERLQSAYAYPGETWTLGYPRTDLLVADDGSRREAVRSNLGAKPDQTVVLYAPTFRDKRTAFLSELDPSTLAEDLGPDYSLLVRGHRMVTTGTGIDTDRFLDVTMYRDITELMLAADVLVTDYSSVMFDFTASGKPVVFFVPDLDEYRDETRGVYFDLAAVAPGPLVETPHELAAALRGLEHDRAEYAGRYAAWQARFNGLDDGHAADRVLDRLDAAVAAARSETTAW